MFTAAFTVPDGNNSDQGIPIFLQVISFMVFVVSDAIDLFFSITSVLRFLSILTSRYAEEDFLCSLPKGLIAGLTTLFISITSMMIVFGATLFIVLGTKIAWIPFPVTLLSRVPVSAFGLLQFLLLVELVLFTMDPASSTSKVKLLFTIAGFSGSDCFHVVNPAAAHNPEVMGFGFDNIENDVDGGWSCDNRWALGGEDGFSRFLLLRHHLFQFDVTENLGDHLLQGHSCSNVYMESSGREWNHWSGSSGRFGVNRQQRMWLRLEYNPNESRYCIMCSFRSVPLYLQIFGVSKPFGISISNSSLAIGLPCNFVTSPVEDDECLYLLSGDLMLELDVEVSTLPQDEQKFSDLG
ncbi:hypothetical protein GIB67_024318 [Kingdonia uniflora]|uniref:PGG domain-containing protein n=1 Tax=Kingdonia uniflora TaxID=39325 RepID=A0A7J7LFE3_9MAGN|nr:hypothetical protein GIB67_024318 [Kingdonia uniflora]